LTRSRHIELPQAIAFAHTGDAEGMDEQFWFRVSAALIQRRCFVIEFLVLPCILIAIVDSKIHNGEIDETSRLSGANCSWRFRKSPSGKRSVRRF
jgi:hypothetical protein